MAIPDSQIKQIQNKIIDVLKADTDLNSAVKLWMFGEPKNPPRNGQYPAVYVEFVGREPADIAESDRFLYNFVYEIGIIERDRNEDDAEKRAEDKMEKAESVLRSNSTLDGLVVADELVPWPMEFTPAQIEDFAMTIAIMQVSYRQWVSA